MASDPLLALLASIEDARELPSPQDHTPSEHPLTALKAQISQFEHTFDDVSGDDAKETSGLADELLAILERSPLSGAARKRAIDAAFRAKREPTAQNVQAILDILVGG